jgi:glycosyltransferase involved in cell wall biosynthesis
MAEILTLSTSYPRFKGDVVAPFIENISKEIAVAGNHIDLLLPFHPEFKRANEKGITFHLYRYTSIKKYLIWGYASSMKADVQLKWKAILLAPKVYLTALKAGKKLLNKKKYNLIHAHWLLPNGFIAMKLAKQFGIPFAVSLHGSDITIAERPAFKRMAKSILKRAAWVSACSEDLRIRAIELGCDPEKIETIPYGVDTILFQPDASRMSKLRRRLKDNLKGGEKILLAVGRLVEKKGFIYLIEAMGKLFQKRRDILCIIAGDGDLKNQLQRKIYDLGVSKTVLLAGNIKRDELQLYFSGCDILVVPSIKDNKGNVDGLPNVLMEGLSSGRAVIASDIAGIPNVITNGINGLLTEPGNSQQIADAIVKLVDDGPLRRRLGTEARRQCLNRYTWKISGGKYANGLKAIIKR